MIGIFVLLLFCWLSYVFVDVFDIYVYESQM